MKRKKSWLIAGLSLLFCGAFVGSISAIAESNDVTAPVVTVDLQGYLQNELPVGQTNTAYPLFTATAYDSKDGDCAVDVKVTKQYSNKNLYDYGTNSFTPKEAGVYTLVYESRDQAGNVGIMKYAFNILDEVATPMVEATLQEAYAVYTGEYFTLQDANVSGGSGRVLQEVVVSLDGVTVEVFDGFKQNVFKPEKSGEYTLTYKTEDFLKRTDAKICKLLVENSDLPVIADLYFPTYETPGTKFDFGAFEAADYSGDGVKKPTENSVIVNYGGEEKTLAVTETFTPKAIGEVGSQSVMSITLRAVGENGETTKTYDVSIVNVQEDNKYFLPAYMVCSNGISVDETGAMKYSVANGNETLAFIKSLVADGFRFGFNMTGTSRISLVLEDSQQEECQVSIALQSNGAATNVFVNGVALEESVAVELNESIIFGYDDAKHAILLNVGGGSTLSTIAILKSYTNGKEFQGFTSGRINFSLTIDKLSAETASVAVETIGNLNVSTESLVSDLTAPELVIDELPKLRVEKGDEFYVPAAIAADVLSDIAYFRLKVTSPSGNVILQNADPTKGYYFTAEEYGVYRISYEVADVHYNKPTGGNKSITVVDRIPPELEIEKNPPTSAVVGEKISFPAYTVSDNCTDEEFLISYIVVISPTFTYYAVFEEYGEFAFTPQTAGEYKVRYYVEDEDGNRQVKEFTLKVKG